MEIEGIQVEAEKYVDEFEWPEGCRDAAVRLAVEILERDPEMSHMFIRKVLNRRSQMAQRVRSGAVYRSPWTGESPSGSEGS